MPSSRKLSPFVTLFTSSVTEGGIPDLFNERSGINNGAQTVITFRFGNTKLRREGNGITHSSPWASY